jgi:tetratricopeptide (TPR) repeat protein
MRLSLPARIAAAIAVCALAAACGQSSPRAERFASAPATVPAAEAQTPRAFELSTRLRPLVSAEASSPPAHSAAFTESSIAAAARIRGMAETPDASAGGLIREPGAWVPEIHEPPPLSTIALRPNNSFVPLVMPHIEPATEGVQPQLATTPSFSRFEESKQPSPALAEAAPAKRPIESYRLAAVSRPASPTAATTEPVAFPAVSNPSPQAEPPGNSPTPMPRIAQGNSPGIQAVAAQVQQMSAQALTMAQRGMLFSARAELLKALQWIAQGLDAEQGGNVHASALAAGLTALDEAAEFQALQAQAADARAVVAIAGRHRTPLLRGEQQTLVSPAQAQQQYLAYARSQLALAVGGLPEASQTLHQLGRLQTGLNATASGSEAMSVPRAMVYHQAALAIDPANHLAANELGVLLARCGQLAEARRLLLQSVSVRPHAEAWHNLAVVHRRLGEADLAKRAEHEWELARRAGRESRATDAGFQWVDPKAFADTGGQPPARGNDQREWAATASAQRR